LLGDELAPTARLESVMSQNTQQPEPVRSCCVFSL